MISPLIKSGNNYVLNCVDLDERQKEAERVYGEFLTVLGYDWQNDSNMCDTPKRVAKMFIREVTRGTYCPEPKITTFSNNGQYSGLVFQGNITVRSLCSHHMAFIRGKCHLSYIPSEKGKIIGLSKLNRIVDWFARRPQLQENLTTQIHDYLVKKLGTCRGVAVMIEAEHTCVSHRGIEDDSTMMTTKLSGVFLDNNNKARDEFYNYIDHLKK
jgi:GTP cyclohydrolase I